MESATGPEEKPKQPTVVTIRGRTITIVPDEHQPGAEARKSDGLRALRSLFDTAREMRERDALLD